MAAHLKLAPDQGDVTALSSPWPTLDPAAFQGLAGEIVRTLEPHTEADPAALLVQLLAAVGNAVGRGPHLLIEADRHHANLFVVIVGETAAARKGTSWGHVRRLMVTADNTWTARSSTGLASGEGLIWQIRDSIERENKDGELEIVDGGVPDKRLPVIDGEFAQTLKVIRREGNTLSPILRQAWDGQKLAAMSKGSPAQCAEPHVTLIGHITLDELRHLLTDIDAAAGLLNRILFVGAARSRVLPYGGDLDPGEVDRLGDALRHALKVAGAGGVLRDDPEARKLWISTYEELSRGRRGILGAVTARAAPQVRRIAMIYALLDCSANIRREHLEAALAVWAYCFETARIAFAGKTGNRLADRILGTLAGHTAGLAREAIRREFAGHATADQMDAAKVLLVELDCIRVEEQPTAGRPREVWIPTGK